MVLIAVILILVMYIHSSGNVLSVAEIIICINIIVIYLKKIGYLCDL